MNRALSSILLVVLCVLAAGRAHADEFGDFQEARGAYDAGDFRVARERFEQLIGGDVPQLRTPTLISESRKYLASTYLFLAEATRAEEQLVLLVRSDPAADVDPLVFPRDLTNLFGAVRARVLDELRAEEEARQRASAARRREEEVAAERAARRLAELERLASEETIRSPNSRLVASLPFGIGQFQNGHHGLGIFFLSAEATFLAANILTFALQSTMPTREEFDTLSAEGQRSAFATESTLTVLNYVSLGLFGATLIAGILDAHVRFVPEHEERRVRALPEELRAPAPTVSFSGSAVTVRW